MKNNQKPKVSFCLLTYNQEKFIEEAVFAALAQDYSSLEIIISDDSSTDNTFLIIERIIENYKGDHYVLLNRNKENLGLVPHLNKVLTDFSTGEYIVLAAGDDISLPNRTKLSVSLLEEHELMCVSFNGSYIDSKSNALGQNIYTKTDAIDYYTIDNFISNYSFNVHGASKAFKRCVFDDFGPLNSDCPTEDSTLSFRGLLLGRIAVCYETMLMYRAHDQNLSRESNIFKLNYKEIADQYKSDLNKFVQLYNHNFEQNRNVLTRIEQYELRENFKRICASSLFRFDLIKLFYDLYKIKSFNFSEKIDLFKLILKSILK